MHMLLLLFFLFMLYAVAGVQLWGDVRYGEYISDAMNFHSIGNALLVLFTMATGENWYARVLLCIILAHHTGMDSCMTVADRCVLDAV